MAATSGFHIFNKSIIPDHIYELDTETPDNI